jgi:hypothetical protein
MLLMTIMPHWGGRLCVLMHYANACDEETRVLLARQLRVFVLYNMCIHTAASSKAC